MSDESAVKVSVKRRIKVIPDRVFGALLDPQRAKKFMFATPNGKMVHVEIEPKVGGKYIFVEERDGDRIEHNGEILKLERPTCIEFKFAIESDAEHEDRVKIEVESLGPWSEVTITHEIHPDFEDQKGKVVEGWNGILDGLAKTIEF